MGKGVLWAALAASAAMISAGARAEAPGGAQPAAAPAGAQPWMNPSLSPDRRADLALGRMTRDEKLSLVFGYFSTDFPPRHFTAPAEGRPGAAGYVPGIPRLHIPPQWQTDAGVGVATQGGAAEKRERTALPSGLAIAASWDPDVAFRGGAMIGAEARASGFNVMLAGGIDLVREPRNGRNFEYGGEDPLLAGTMIGNAIRGIQSNRIISTIKHYALNDQETGRDRLNVTVDRDAARMSDLLAFQIGIEHGDPGSVMCSYNQVEHLHACENPWLLTEVLRRDWRWPGYVMSDWGATHSTVAAANAGLDQDSGYPFDEQPYFREPLRAAIAGGQVSEARLNEMAHRILRSMFAHGLVDRPVVPGPIDMAAHAAITRAAAEAGAVLLKNDGRILPLSPSVRSIAIIGSHADVGVLSGGGSSQVYPVGGNAAPGIAPTGWPGPVVYYPSSPMAAIRAQAPHANIRFASGDDPEEAARLARESEVAIVFAHQWTSESIDTSLTLPDRQDAMIAAVAAANPRAVVVLETGGPVLMPWLDRVPAVLEAWFPGTNGGPAIAGLLFGRDRLHPAAADRGELFGRRGGGLSLVRGARPQSALRLRPRPLLYRFRLWRPQRRGARRRSDGELHRAQHRPGRRRGGAANLCRARGWRLGGAEAARRLRQDPARPRRPAARHPHRRSAAAGDVSRRPVERRGRGLSGDARRLLARPAAECDGQAPGAAPAGRLAPAAARAHTRRQLEEVAFRWDCPAAPPREGGGAPGRCFVRVRYRCRARTSACRSRSAGRRRRGWRRPGRRRGRGPGWRRGTRASKSSS
jgi:beta-glucosidase